MQRKLIKRPGTPCEICDTSDRSIVTKVLKLATVNHSKTLLHNDIVPPHLKKALMITLRSLGDHDKG